MKLHFEPDLDYQHTAIEAVCDLFRGQEINRTEFTVTRRPRPLRDSTGQAGLDLGAFTGVQGELGLVENELGIGNRLSLLDDEIVTNLKDIQLRNRSEEHTSELQSLMRISYAVFCLKKKRSTTTNIAHKTTSQIQ